MDGQLSVPTPWAWLRERPPLRALDGATQWLATLDWQRMDPGQVLPPLSAGQWWAVASGELKQTADGRCQGFFEGPCWLANRGDSRLAVIDDAVVARVDASDLHRLDPSGATTAALYESELVRHDEARFADARKDDDFFANDGAALVPGPYQFGPYQATALVMDDDPGVLRHELPPGLSLAPGMAGKYLLVLSEVERCRALHPDTDGREHRYLEIAAFVPCLGPRLVPGLYLPRVYPDAYLPILLGREAYGFAKRLGRIVRRDADDGYDLIASGRHILRARWSATDATTPTAPWWTQLVAFTGQLMKLGRPRLFLHKQILGVEAGDRARPCIDQLVTLPFRVDTLSQLQPLSGPTVSFPEPGWGLGGRCLGGARMQLGFQFADGKITRDYGAARR